MSVTQAFYNPPMCLCDLFVTNDWLFLLAGLAGWSYWLVLLAVLASWSCKVKLLEVFPGGNH